MSIIIRDGLSRRAMLAGMAGGLASLSLPEGALAQAGGRRVLVIASNQDIPTFDPHVATGYSASFLLRNVYDSLVRVEGNPPKPVPALAASWTSTPTAANSPSSSIRPPASIPARQ